MPRRPGKAGHDGNRHRENKRARRSNNENGDRADRIASEEPGDGGDQHGDSEKDYREAIGESRHWRLGALRPIDQAHDTGISAFGGAVRYGEIECLAGVGGPAHYLIASVLLDRDRLTRERGLIEDRKRTCHHPGGGDHSAPSDQQTVARHDQV
jgi:hypothetical protein